MKTLQKIISSISLTILVLCCGASLLFGWSATGWQALAIPTSSMTPAIPKGSLVLVRRVPVSSLKIGDVITYINPLNAKATISHRVVKKYLVGGKIPAFVTKGDANKFNDIPITEGSVEGQVVWHAPNLGYLLLAAKNPLLILPFIYIAAALLMAEEVKRLSDYYKLSQPYRLLGFVKVKKQSGNLSKRFAYCSGAALIAVVMLGVAITPPALALLSSNIVTLANNRLTVAPVTQCSGNTSNSTSININNNSTQSGNSGNSTVNGNTNGGSASSGSVNNSNSSSTTITINNC